MARTDRGEARSARPAKRTGAATATKPRSRSRTGAARSLAVPQPEPASVPQRRSSRAAPTKAEAGEREERRGTARARHAPRTAGMRQQTWPEGRKVATHVFQKESYVRLAPSRSSPAGFAPAKRRLPAHRRWRFPGCSPWKPAAAKWLLARSGAQRGARRFAAEMGKVSYSRVERNFPALREARGTQSSPPPPANPAGRPPAPSTARTAPTRPVPPRRAAPPAHLTRPHLTSRRGPARSRPVRPPRAEALSVLRGRDAGTRAAPRMGGGAPPPGVPERGCSAPQDPRRLPGGRGTASAAPPLPWLRLRLAPTAWLGPRLLPPGGRTALRRARGRRGATGRGAWPPRPALERLLAAPRAGGAGVGGDARRNPRGAGNGTFRRRRGADVPGGRWAMAGGRRSPWTPGPLLLPPPWVPPGWQRPVRARGGSP